MFSSAPPCEPRRRVAGLLGQFERLRIERQVGIERRVVQKVVTPSGPHNVCLVGQPFELLGGVVHATGLGLVVEQHSVGGEKDPVTGIPNPDAVVDVVERYRQPLFIKSAQLFPKVTMGHEARSSDGTNFMGHR